MTPLPTIPIDIFEASNPPAGVYWVHLRHIRREVFAGQLVRQTTFRWEVAWWKHHRLSSGTGEMLWDVAGAWQTSEQLGIFRVGPYLGNSPRDMFSEGVLLDLPL